MKYDLISILVDTPTLVISLLLLVVILFSYLAGSWLGKYQLKHNPQAKADGVGPLEGALLGLLALLLSFTFSMSASRYDKRQEVIVEEANAIGTLVLRTALYPDSIRDSFREDLRVYIETRISYYETRDEKRINELLQQSATISKRIWERAAALSRSSGTTMPQSLVLPAINDMIDSVTTRDAARQARVPDAIFWLLIILIVLGSLIIGYSKKEKKNDWIVITIYSMMTVVTTYTIMDLDRPRHGIIKTDGAHKKMVELRDLFRE